MSFFNGKEYKVTLGTIPRLPDDVLEYVAYEAADGEFAEEIADAAQDELGKREHYREQFPQDDTPSLQDRGIFLGSYES